jgi:hypothetical protein
MARSSSAIWARLRRHSRGRAPHLLALALLAAPAMAGERVSTELVLAVDVSLSVNDIEFALQMQGIAAALRDPEVIALIGGRENGIAVVMTQWSGTYRAEVPLPWRRLDDQASVLAYADAVAGMERMQFGNLTGIGNAIAFASELLTKNEFDGDERKIDVSGDGRNNTGPEPEAARAAAMAQNITINGLAIAADDPALPSYYSDNVIGGPGAFVVVAKDFEAFGEAFRRKLKRELAPRLALK